MESLKILKKFYKSKKIFITGHTGFKGTWLSIILNYLEAKVYGYALSPKKESLFKLTKIKNKISSNTYGDIRNYNKLKKKIKLYKPEIIFHLAAQPLVIESYEKPVETFHVNTMGTLHLLESIRNVRTVKSVIIVTTDKVYKIGKKNKRYKENDQLGGSDPYSSSKVGAEVVTESYIKSFFEDTKLKNKISIVRAGNVIGGGDFSKNRLIPDILKTIKSKKNLKIRNPNHVRPWQHVLDPLVGYLLLAKKQHLSKINGEKNNSWNFGPNKNNFKKVIDVVKFVQKLEKFKFSIDNKKKLHETAVLKLDSSKAKDKLNWSSKWNLSVALKKTLEWNNSLNKEISPEKKCVQQFLMYMNSK